MPLGLPFPKCYSRVFARLHLREDDRMDGRFHLDTGARATIEGEKSSEKLLGSGLRR